MGRFRRRQRPADHPRSRGVYADGWRGRWSLFGIIPARAGFTRPRGRGGRGDRDHPRSRGVYAAASIGSVVAGGSSPLARGLQDGDGPNDAALGIIPARAGFTRGSRRWRPRGGDHPRSRGVYISFSRPSWPVWGSSPLARGLPSRRPRRPPPAADHPRSRGVYTGTRSRSRPRDGSSPLARGLRTHSPTAPTP